MVAPASLPGTTEGHLLVQDEAIVYKRYLTVYNRTVQYPPRPNGEESAVEYDIVGHPQAEFKYAVVFPFHPKQGGGGEVTILKEYNQGINDLAYCLPTGGFSPKNHTNMEACAAAELSEEAHLCGGKYVRLLPEDHPGIPELKWSRNRFIPYLVIAPEADRNPGGRDFEEIIEEVKRVSIPELKQIMFSGNMQTPSIVTAAAALEYLQQNGMLSDEGCL
eukprot:CAMPEP_0198215104 /NCGR_PEP_ID=MMETSP1445-20131203/47116_1 /TAXON_ID=36898 /ORGANISM="Pyramimonas sp., Strain CCMP2087" /LENGTH=218 /DNA_ID=CAMNT_0043890657 /DNA_START=225 /DNA_END=881 /DNA_ORIENTATION=-